MRRLPTRRFLNPMRFDVKNSFLSAPRRAKRLRPWQASALFGVLLSVGLGCTGVAAASAAECANEPLRLGASALLPDCRGYEMISPESTQAQRSTPQAISSDGNYLLFNNAGIFAEAPGMNKVGGSYVARRTPTGWVTKSLNPPAAQFPVYDQAGAFDWSSDLHSTLWLVRPIAAKGSNDWTFYVRHDDGTEQGSWFPASPSLAGNSADGTSTGEVVGASGTLDSIIVSSAEPIAPTDGTVNTRVYSAQRKSLYRMSRSPTGAVHVEQLAYQNGATMFTTCTVGLGGAANTARGAYSEDGRTAFLNFGASCSGAGVGARVWAWREGQGVIDVSAPRCSPNCSTPGGGPANVLFEGASRDGQRVYFSTAQQLVSADGATGNALVRRNLYEYDFSRTGNELIPVTTDPGTAGAGVRKLVRLSEDGSRAYFVSTGRSLAGPNARNQSPVPGGNNLYVYHRPAGAAQGTTEFIGTLSANDSGLWAGDSNQRQAITAPHDGRFFVFASDASLTADKLAGDAHPDVYRYDAQTDELRRAWTDDPAHNGAQRTAGAAILAVSGQDAGNALWETSRRVSDDGRRVYLSTMEPLASEDQSGTNDGYLWDAQTGEASLISSGKDPEWGGAGVMSPSGDSLTFMSGVPLVPGQTSTTVAAYVARVGGGFAAPDPERPPCADDACQPASDLPPLLPTGRSDGPQVGNVIQGTTPRALSRVTVPKPKLARGTRATLTVRAPAAGTIRVSGSGIRAARKSTKTAGTTKLSVRLSKKSAARLRKSGKVNVRVRVQFRADGGGTSSTRITVRFRAAKAGS